MIELVLLAHAVVLCVALVFWFAFRGERSGEASLEQPRAAISVRRADGSPREHTAA